MYFKNIHAAEYESKEGTNIVATTVELAQIWLDNLWWIEKIWKAPVWG